MRAFRYGSAVVAAAALLAAGLSAGTARADTASYTCTVNGQLIQSPVPCDYGTGPAGLLNEMQLTQPDGLYAVSGTAQQQQAELQSLNVFEQDAVKQTLADHNLPASETAAAQTWGRDDAEAELWAEIESAITATDPTPDQQNVVAWLAGVVQRHAVQTATAAGLEYVKWAGLDQAAYEHLVASSPSESQLQAFLSQNPQTYNNGGTANNPKVSTGGYCVYQSPAPYQGDYYNNIYTSNGENAPEQCFGQCPEGSLCLPPTPSYDQFVKWGTADVDKPLMDNAGFVLASHDIATAAGFGVAAAGTGAGIGLSFLSSDLLVESGVVDALLPDLLVYVNGYYVLGTAEVAEIAGSVTAAAIGATVGIVIAAIAIAVTVGINLGTVLQVPVQLAQLINGAQTSTPNLAAMLSDPTQGSALFSLFVGATDPAPLVASCDNSQLLPVGGSIPQPCLNPPDILPISSSDPVFTIQAKGATTTSTSSTISWHDAQLDTDNTARVAGRWFVNRITNSDGFTATAQFLHVSYTDWSGTEQTAWLADNGSGQPIFITLASVTSSSPPPDPKTCVADAECAAGPSIQYVGTDGKDYTATLAAPPAPTGPAPTVTMSLPTTSFAGPSPAETVTGSFTPATATDTGTISITWQDGTTTTEDYGPGVSGSTGGAFSLTPDGAEVDYSVSHAMTQPASSSLITVTVTSQDGQSASASNDLGPPTVTIVPASSGLAFTTPLPARAYGDAPFPVTAQLAPPDPAAVLFASGTNPVSGQPVCQLGPQTTSTATVFGGGAATDTTATLILLAAGTCTLLAGAPPTGTADVATAAPVTTSFTVAPAPLTITAHDATVSAGSALPSFTATITGLVNGDHATALTGEGCYAADASGQPLTTTPGPGSYQILCDGSDPDYAITFVPGTLTVLGTQAITFPGPPDHAYGDPAFPVSATGGASGQPVTFTSSTPGVCAVSKPTSGTDASGNGTGGATVTIAGAGACTLTANQAAGGSYAAAPAVSQTFTVTKAPLTITADNQSMTYGGPVPAFTSTASGLVNGDTSSVVSGLTCGAVDASGNPVSATTLAGSYQITCSGGTAANYTISYKPGTLHIALFAVGALPVSGTGSGDCHLAVHHGTLIADGTLSVNGTSATALCVTGGGSITAPTIDVQGGVQNTGGSTLAGTVHTGQPAATDPLATLPAPTAPSAACPGPACPAGTTADRGQTLDLQPGAYSQPITINKGGTVCVAPGIYVLQADWRVYSGTVLPDGAPGCPVAPAGTTDPGVLLYFAAGQLVLTGTGQVTALQAMKGGPYAGLLYWQASGLTTALDGSAAFAGGGWYEPDGALELNGSATLTAPYVSVNNLTVNDTATLHVTAS